MLIKLKCGRQILIVLYIKLKLEMSMKTSKKIELFDVSDYPKVTQYYNN